MKILAVTSGKGGVGKTTISLNLAKQLSLSGCKTLLIDLDIHNKGATSLFLDIVERACETKRGLSFAGMIARRNTGTHDGIDSLRCAIDDENLSFIPATLPKEMVEWSALQASKNDELMSTITSLLLSEEKKQAIDIVVLDCYGGIDSLTIAACGVADDTLIVNEPDLITFSGTLLLYAYLSNVYRESPRNPNVHFVINRITTRHTFRFLDKAYRENLAMLSSGTILGYLPYDRLVVETFGEYPFFSELLPKSLITRKLRLILFRLYSSWFHFADIERMSQGKRQKLFEQTSEARLADPEKILRAMISIPIWVVSPTLMLLAVSLLSRGYALPYSIVWQLIYVPTAMLILLALALGFFEPIQISRWLLRVAKFRRRKRLLKRKFTRSIRGCLGFLEFLYASLPGVFGFAFVIGLLAYGYQALPSGFRDISRWHGNVYGFSQGGNYSRLRMADEAGFLEGIDVTGAHFENSDLTGVSLSQIKANRANFAQASLINSNFESSSLQSASFEGASVAGATFKNADLANASFRSAYAVPGLNSFAGATLSGTDFSGSNAPLSVLLFAQLQGAKMDESQIQAVNSWRGLNPGKGESFAEIAALSPDTGRSESQPESERESLQKILRGYESQRSRSLEKSMQLEEPIRVPK